MLGFSLDPCVLVVHIRHKGEFGFRLHAKCMVIQGQKLPVFEKIGYVS